MIHIVICDNKDSELEKLINKERTMLIRGNASRKIPHSRIFVNDELYFVKKGEYTSKYKAIVKDAESLSRLTNEDIDKIFDKYKERLNLSSNEEKKWKKICLCIIVFSDIEEIKEIKVPNYNNLNDWLMFNNIDELNK